MGGSRTSPHIAEDRKRRKKKGSRGISPSSTSIDCRVRLFGNDPARRDKSRGPHREKPVSHRRRNPHRDQFKMGRISPKGSALGVSGHGAVRSGRPSQSSAHLPSFLGKRFPVGKDELVSLEEDPNPHKRRERDWESVADALSANVGV